VKIRLVFALSGDFTLWLSPNSKQKTQGCVRFPRKSYAMTAKIPGTSRYYDRDRQSFLLKQQ